MSLTKKMPIVGMAIIPPRSPSSDALHKLGVDKENLKVVVSGLDASLSQLFQSQKSQVVSSKEAQPSTPKSRM